MSTPRSIRMDDALVSRLAAYAARHPGMSSSGAAAMFIDEGLRMAAHPGIVFRDGPSGRRAGLASGPDVWEVTRAIRDARAAQPRLSDTQLLAQVVEQTGLSTRDLHVALSYYGEYRDEVDLWMRDADDAEDRVERILANTHDLLGA